jgi:iron complex outermembrane receptor protein
VASDVLLTVEPAVGVYVDGFNVPHPYGLSAGLFDIERVEVLKGPQGTLYGRNTTGGAVNIISKGADYSGLHGFLFGEAGNHRNLRFNGAVNVPIVEDKVAVRLAAQVWDRKGYGTSRITGRDLGGDKGQIFVRGSLRADPTDTFRIELKGEWTRMREHGFLMAPLWNTGQAATSFQAAFELGLDPFSAAARTQARAFLDNIAAMGRDDPFTADTALLATNKVDRKLISGSFTWDMSENTQLKSITGYSKVVSNPLNDLDATRFHILEIGILSPGPQTFPQFDRNVGKFFSQEFNLSGSAFDDRITWLVGAYYSREKGADATTNNFRIDQTRLASAATLLPPGSPFTINFNQGIDIKNSSWSLFTQEDFKILETLTATLGWRYTEETHGVNQVSRRFAPSTGQYLCSFVNAPGTNTPLITTNPITDCSTKREATFTGNSWLASLNWQLTPQTLVYLKTAQGFRGGGWNLRVITAPAFSPEKARDIEIGLKSDFFDGRLRTNLAAYKTDYSNKQESIIIPVGLTPQTVVQNAASATIKGLEAEITARPVEGLTLRSTVSHLKGKYDSFPGALNLFGARVDGTGEKFANPRWQYSLSARYEHEIGPGVAGIQADWSHQSGAKPPPRLQDPNLPALITERLVAGTNNFAVATNDLGLLNLRIDYRMPDQGLTFAVFANNALDKTVLYYTLNQSALGGVQGAIVGEPRMWGVQVRKTFGSE